MFFGGEYDTVPFAYYPSVVGNNNDTIYEIDVTDIVQEMVDGVRPNYGFILRGLFSNTLPPKIRYPSFEFWSSDCIQYPPYYRPKLIVTYDDSSVAVVPKLITTSSLMFVKHDRGNITITFPSIEENEVSLFDLSGKLIYSNITRNKSMEINCDNICLGMYLLSVFTKESGLKTQKLLLP